MSRRTLAAIGAAALVSLAVGAPVGSGASTKQCSGPYELVAVGTNPDYVAADLNGDLNVCQAKNSHADP
jgi:hypothetical protein